MFPIRHILALTAFFFALSSISSADEPFPKSLLVSDNPDLIFLLVEKKDCKLSVYKGYPEWKKLSEYPCTTGQVSGDKYAEGDLKTPTGIYWFTAAWLASDLKEKYGVIEALPYGAGAFPLNYPNYLDRLFDRKTGHGIWLHGTENDQPIVTQGCVSVSNPNFLEIAQYIQIPNTLAVIVEEIQPLTKLEHGLEVAKLKNFISAWEKAWESENSEQYFSFYSDRFKTSNFNKKNWLRYKKQLNNRNKNREVQISNLTLLYSKGIYQAHFLQKYESSEFSDLGWKTLYFEFDENHTDFRIVSETWEPYDTLTTIPKTADASKNSQGKM